MRIILKALSMLSAAMLTLSCIGNTWNEESFIQDDCVRLENNGNVLFSYNPLDCQISFNRESREFRAFTDYMTDYFYLTLSEIPVSKGQSVRGDLRWSTLNGESNRYNIALETIRLKGDIIWLWCESARMAIVVKVLD